jgi:hypothetical protein
MRDAIISRKRGEIFNKIELAMNVGGGGLMTSRYAIVIYRPRKKEGMHK